jgi:hypothetical protein
MTHDDLVYAAGLFDGEGCIQIARQKHARGRNKKAYFMLVTLTMVDPLLPSWLHRGFGGTLFLSRLSRKNPAHRDAWFWSACGANALHFLEVVGPFMRQKKPQADVAIDYQKRNHRVMSSDAKDVFYMTLRQLKRINVGDLPKIAPVRLPDESQGVLVFTRDSEEVA